MNELENWLMPHLASLWNAVGCDGAVQTSSLLSGNYQFKWRYSIKTSIIVNLIEERGIAENGGGDSHTRTHTHSFPTDGTFTLRLLPQGSNLSWCRGSVLCFFEAIICSTCCRKAKFQYLFGQPANTVCCVAAGWGFLSKYLGYCNTKKRHCVRIWSGSMDL